MIQFACPSCGHLLKVKDEVAGKKGKCFKCQQAIQVPATGFRVAEDGDPFAFLNPASAVTNSAAPLPNPLAPPVETPSRLVPPPPLTARSPSRSPRFASYFGVFGAGLGGLVMVLTGATDQPLVDGLLRFTPEVGEATIRGALLGSIGGLAVCGILLLLLGRNWASLCGAVFILGGGAAYGAIRKAENAETGMLMLIVGAVIGVVFGASVGALIRLSFAALGGRNET